MTDDQRVDYLVDIHTQLLEEREMHLHDGHTNLK
jgi:hypothetical protein